MNSSPKPSGRADSIRHAREPHVESPLVTQPPYLPSQPHGAGPDARSPIKPTGASVWRPGREETGEAAWEDADVRQVAKRRLWAAILALVVVVVGVALIVVTLTQWWHHESFAKWLVTAGAGIAAAGVIAAVFAFLAYIRVRTTLRAHSWTMTTLHFDPTEHPRDTRVVTSQRSFDPYAPLGTADERRPPQYRADFPGATLDRMKGATVRLPVAGDEKFAVVSLSAGARSRSRLGILRAHPAMVSAAKAAAKQRRSEDGGVDTEPSGPDATDAGQESAAEKQHG